MTGVPLLQDHLESAARRLPAKTALVCRGERLTYGEVDARANAFAHALVRRGVRRGDRVLVFCDDAALAAVAFWGVLKANAVVSIVHPGTRADRLAHLLVDCAAAALVCDAPLLAIVRAAAPSARELRATFVAGESGGDDLPGGVGWEAALAQGPVASPPPRRCIESDLAALIYTSGSTGEPKGVMLTHRNMLAAAASVDAYLQHREDDVILCALPLAFSYGLYQMILAFQAGARVVLERSFVYPAQILKTVVEERVTVLPGVPTLFALLVELRELQGLDLGCVRTVTNAGAALAVPHLRAVRALFPRARVFSMYGLTECKRCSYLPPEDLDRKPESVGIAIPNVELWIVGENDRRLGPGEVGQLVVRGPTVMRGYWGKPQATAERLRPGPLPGERVLYTGDLCKLDEEGYLTFVARMDDIIKSRGEKVAPREVEGAILEVPGVREAAVVGVPDRLLGEAIAAFVVPRDGAQLSEKDVQRHCQRRLPSFMVPKRVEIVSSLPKSSTGKVRRTELR